MDGAVEEIFPDSEEHPSCDSKIFQLDEKALKPDCFKCLLNVEEDCQCVFLELEALLHRFGEVEELIRSPVATAKSSLCWREAVGRFSLMQKASIDHLLNDFRDKVEECDGAEGGWQIQGLASLGKSDDDTLLPGGGDVGGGPREVDSLQEHFLCSRAQVVEEVWWQVVGACSLVGGGLSQGLFWFRHGEGAIEDGRVSSVGSSFCMGLSGGEFGFLLCVPL